MIVEVVSAFIRTTTPQRTSGPTPGGFGTCPDDKFVTADISAALTILTRRDRAHGPRPIDMRGTCLRGVDLYSKDLRGLDLTAADLSGGNLRGARLSETILRGTQFTRASLRDANLNYANAMATDFTSADLVSANFTNANLIDAVFVNANISHAHFEKNVLMGADFTGAVHNEFTVLRNITVNSRTRGIR